MHLTFQLSNINKRNIKLITTSIYEINFPLHELIPDNGDHHKNSYNTHNSQFTTNSRESNFLKFE